MPDFAVMVTLLSVMGADGRLCSRESLWTEEQREEAATCDMPSIIFKDDNGKKSTFHLDTATSSTCRVH